MAALAFLIDANAFISIGPALVVFNPINDFPHAREQTS